MTNNIVGQPQSVQVPNYSGVNIQIFNPSVAAPGASVPAANVNSTNYTTNPASAYPANYYTQNYAPPLPAPVVPVTPAQVVKDSESTAKKTETREIVQITDDYVRTLENYLNNQDNQVRLIGAKEVLARLQEDDSRRNDEALNALVNKMLQDPYQPIRFMAMGMLESRAASGNDKTKLLLQNIQQQKTGNGQDELKASNVLLKMSGPLTKKEFEVQDKPKSKPVEKPKTEGEK